MADWLLMLMKTTTALLVDRQLNLVDTGPYTGLKGIRRDMHTSVILTTDQ